MKSILDKLITIQKTLNLLSKEIDDVTEIYYGNKFDDQQKIASYIENMLLALTHETASTIGFMCQDLEQAVNLFSIREKYSQLTDIDFEEIIDSEIITMSRKKELISKLDNRLATLSTIKEEWNTLFRNRSYRKVASSIK